MDWRHVSRLILGATVAAAVALLASAAYLYWTSPSPDIIVLSPASTAQPETASEAEFAFTPLEEPRPLPELRFVDGDGRALTLADFAGRVVLLNVWATWCVPCRQEMPSLDRLQAMLGGPDFEVVALSIDREGLPAVEAFYEELGLQALDIYLDTSGTLERDLSIVGIPTTLLVNRNGNEIGRSIGPATWDSPEVVAVIRPYLEEPSKQVDGSQVLRRTALSSWRASAVEAARRSVECAYENRRHGHAVLAAVGRR